MNTGRSRYEIENYLQGIEIKTVKELKICGMWYCNYNEKEYRLNITKN
jgi:hypothetical protein